ncbi:hypothetical protein [Microterricola viridarii]|uniref:Uncharacterized protein n=1 Tax=Microterricola viridarii TaxID=412690 RepID=A0A0Y0MY99_9MICO|nr:hypothetical protein [Microterricola viridarii]AMB58019.1 hypothetical protein AWU67_03090 [Microterricola viridarii]
MPAAGDPLRELTDDMAGRYLVTTTSGSRYWLDLDERSLCRIARTDDDETLTLLRDGEKVDLIDVERCEVAQPMVVLVDLHVENVWCTTRESTPVVSIIALSPRAVLQ